MIAALVLLASMSLLFFFVWLSFSFDQAVKKSEQEEAGNGVTKIFATLFFTIILIYALIYFSSHQTDPVESEPEKIQMPVP